MKETAGRSVNFERKSLSDSLISYIKEQILAGHMNPGDRIVETQLARELGVSQTPIREAMRLLSGEGIVTLVPNKGPIVSPVSAKDAFEIYSLRAVLEGLAIRLATQTASEEAIQDLVQFYEAMKQKVTDDSVESLLEDSLYIHTSIYKLSNHQRVISMLESISFQISLVNKILGTASTKQKEVDVHWELIEALQSRDPDRAEEVMRKHIHRSYQDFSRLQEVKHEHETPSGFGVRADEDES